ncbi:MAG: Gfo/Idh/MocA family oxidoreductase [Chloroflexi bacterium]|nr:Gfo/Idh/MocA family oxidoreductase [Chloroflexota bacterium]OJV95317.1 MAG: hypothetical protein BGO39_25305 [Chloroflexi bacterium 54-19]
MNQPGQTSVNVGLVGVGRWGQQHIAALEKAAQGKPGTRLVALCAGSAESANQAEARWGIPCDSDFQRFLERKELEAVIFSTPNYLHYSMTRQALEAGKHVLVEKPMSFTPEECDDLIALAARQQKVLFPGHEFRFFTLWESFKELLAGEAIGKPRYGSLELRRYPYNKGAGGWRHDPDRVGDWLLEEPIHYFDLALWFMLESAGPPTRLYAVSSAGSPERAAWHENFSALLNFKDGSYVQVTRTVASFDFRLQIHFTGTKGTLEGSWCAATDRDLNPRADLTLFRFGEAAPRHLEVSQQTGHAYDLHREIEAFAAAVRNLAPGLSGLAGRQAVYLCQAAARSLNSGQTVDLTGWK